jgi:hypothetical protein
MRRFVLGWKKLGLEQSLGTRLVTYADDLVILCRRGSAENALHHLRQIVSKLKLTVNEEKTRICRVPDGEFDFLGYTFGRMYSLGRPPACFFMTKLNTPAWHKLETGRSSRPTVALIRSAAPALATAIATPYRGHAP